METTIRVRPCLGLRVDVPGRPGMPLADAGEVVPRNTYWMRRIQHGEVEEVKAAEKAAEKAPETPAAPGKRAGKD